jgi:hypothetical protein
VAGSKSNQFCQYKFEAAGNSKATGTCEALEHLKAGSAGSKAEVHPHLMPCYSFPDPKGCQHHEFNGQPLCYWNKGIVMVVEGHHCSNANELMIGTELSGKTLDQCEQLCSTHGLCERIAYGREPESKSRKCQLIKVGCK